MNDHAEADTEVVLRLPRNGHLADILVPKEYRIVVGLDRTDADVTMDLDVQPAAQCHGEVVCAGLLIDRSAEAQRPAGFRYYARGADACVGYTGEDVRERAPSASVDEVVLELEPAEELRRPNIYV